MKKITDKTIIAQLESKGIRPTPSRQLVLTLISQAEDHPDTQQLFNRITKVHANFSIATLYRTLRLFKDKGLLKGHHFGDEIMVRYEKANDDHHDHIIDIDSGHIIEFHNSEIERIQKKLVEKLGYEIVGHRHELFCRKVKIEENNEK